MGQRAIQVLFGGIKIISCQMDFTFLISIPIGLVLFLVILYLLYKGGVSD